MVLGSWLWQVLVPGSWWHFLASHSQPRLTNFFSFLSGKFICVEKQVDSLLSTLPSFIEKCKRFQDIGQEINSRCDTHRVLLIINKSAYK